MKPTVNLIGVTFSQLLNSICRTHPDITFTDNPALSQINVIFGTEALQRFDPSWDASKHHCYVFNHDGHYVVPAYELKSQFIEPDRIHWITHAIAKACDLASGAAKPDVPIEYTLEPSLLQVQDFVADALCCDSSVLSLDIETIMGTSEITAFAIAYRNKAISIPFATYGMEPYWSSDNELEVWRLIQSILASAKVKLFQNYIFDTTCLANLGLETKPPLEDTLIIANILNPELPKSLADLARMYCYCPPWKDKKDFNLTGNPVDFWRYNAQDASRTLQIYIAQQQELNIRKLRNFYETHTRPLLPLVYTMCIQGIAVDSDALSKLNDKIACLTTPIEAELATIAQPLMPPGKPKRNKEKDIKGPSPKTGKIITLTKGYDNAQEIFNPNSNKQIKEVLRTLGYKIPSFKGKETTDRRALLKLNRKRTDPFISAFLKYGKLQKLRSSYGSIATDADGRCRYSFNIGGTKSGRFSCQGTAWGTGLNIQTIPRKNKELDISFRDIFIPADKASSFLQVDLSQAELRVVAWLSGEEKLIRMLAANEDIHTFMAKEIERVLGRTADRNFGKFLNHATNYGVGANKLCDMALDKLDINITQQEAQAFLDVRKRTFPMIYRWHDSIRSEIFRTRKLTSPHGRERYFYGMITDDTIREALSFIPQATVVDVLNDAWLLLSQSHRYNKDFSVVAQCHDSLLIDMKDDKLDYVLYDVNDAFAQQEIAINGNARTIPWDCELGKSWGGLRRI